MKLGINIEDAQNRLIITAYTYRMARIEELLQMIDKPGKLKQFRYRQLRYTMAKALATQVEKLTEQLGTASVTVSAPTPTRDARGRPVPQQPSTSAKKGESAVFLDVDERTNRILMIGTPEQLDVVDTLIDSLDVARQDLRTLKVYEIQYVGAEEIIDKLNQLGIISSGRITRSTPGRITPTQQRTQTTRPGQPKAPAAEQPPVGTVLTEEGLVDEPQVVVIEATNSLMVNATAEQHAQIVTIIGYVDAEPEQTAINYVVYPLENQDPTELAGVLQQLVQETIQETQDKGSNVIRTTTRERFEEDVTIIAEPKTYSLIVYASKKNQQWIKSLIEQLDQYRPQVLLDVTLVQITKDDAFHFDLQLLGSYPDFEYAGSIDNTDFWSNLLNSTDRDAFLEGSVNLGNFTGFYGTEQINALLSAVETKRYGRVMARPKLLVNDNETGSIQTTSTTYVARTESSVIGTDNPKETQSTVFENYSAGITLNITPHISTGDMLRLQITLNRSGFTEALEGLTKPPNKDDSDVDTVVTVPNNSTIILGGVEKISDSKGGAKVPLLGDLPLVGGLFRDVTRSGGHDRLYIFVKAHILRPGNDLGLQDLKEVSRKNREKFEQLEAEMQEYSDWPGLKPKPLDPVKILEED
jgi:type II secretory pathway component GspD/PulD (secretin)